MLHQTICVLLLACLTASAQTDLSSSGTDVSQLKTMVTSLQQQVAAMHNTLLTQQTMSVDEVCRTRFGQGLTQGGAVTKPKDCVEVQKAGNSQSGKYKVTPHGETAEIDVYCDMDTDGGGWLLIQERQDGKVDFYRTFSEYENGFGDVEGEHWLGNKHIHAITSSGKYELLVVLEDFQQHVKTAHYKSFSVGDAGSIYRLSVSDYNGTAGDSLMFDHNGQQFSTHDADNDGDQTANCAEKHHGGYWYSRCFKSNINGKWGVAGAQGIVWGSFKDWQMYVLKHTEMKIRPLTSN